MKKHQIEHKVLSIIDQVMSGQPNEDFTVELKSEWPKDFNKAARLIAGHANAARGEAILWLIGVDQKNQSVTGADHMELADWFAKVKAQFDGVAPNLLVDINIPVGDKTVAALYFETDRAPFVVKNKDYGNSGVSVEREVPWREGTSTRTATRADLIKLLSPLQKLPTFELRSGELNVRWISNQQDSNQKEMYWSLEIMMYVESHLGSEIVIPFHRCHVALQISEFSELIYLNNVRLQPLGCYVIDESIHIENPPALYTIFKSLSSTINAENEQVLINGSGTLILKAWENTQVRSASFENKNIQLNASFPPIGADRSVSISAGFIYSTTSSDETKWILR